MFYRKWLTVKLWKKSRLKIFEKILDQIIWLTREREGGQIVERVVKRAAS
jgi:hypothetical protein